MKNYVKVLSIAGSDSGGGAGIQADIKTISSLGGFATTAITCVTAQNTIGVQKVDFLSPKAIRMQIESVLSDIGVDAIKIGMLGSAEIIKEVAKTLKAHQHIPIVLDPVMVATSGDLLSESGMAKCMAEVLFPLSTLITPNLFELEVLSNLDLNSEEAFDRAAKILHEKGAEYLLVTGGDSFHELAIDRLYSKGCLQRKFETKKIKTNNTHGTGCSFSSAITFYIAQGLSVSEAIVLAKKYIESAIYYGARYKIGHGQGPVHHFWKQEL